MDEELKEEDTTTIYLHALYWCLGLMTGMADGSVPYTPFQYVFTLVIDASVEPALPLVVT